MPMFGSSGKVITWISENLDSRVRPVNMEGGFRKGNEYDVLGPRLNLYESLDSQYITRANYNVIVRRTKANEKLTQ